MELFHTIKKQPDEVYAFLTDMKKFVDVHPIIYKMDDLGNGNYKVYEKLGLFSFTYKAHVYGDPTQLIVNIKAVVMKLVHIEMRFELTEQNKKTTIHETVTFRSALPVKPLLKRIFIKQHQHLFLNIEHAL